MKRGTMIAARVTRPWRIISRREMATLALRFIGERIAWIGANSAVVKGPATFGLMLPARSRLINRFVFSLASVFGDQLVVARDHIRAA
jgi:hypothetical protein